MKTSARTLRRAGLLLGAIAAGVSALAYTFILNDHTGLPVKWAAGSVPLRIMLGNSRTLSDGTNFNTSAQAAAQTWNAVIGSAQFTTTLVASGTPGDNNDVNDVAFASTVYGKSFGDGVIAVTTGYSIGNERVESDTIFNDTLTWDSYRGNLKPSGALDLQRVAIH